MGAFVNHEFKRGFFLDEERLRRLNDILSSRGSQVNPDCKPVYKVYREDSFSYTTNDIQDILREDNSDWQHIQRITLTMKFADNFDLELDFNNQGETTLHIEGEDRDVVFLIFSELRQYLSNEVNIIGFSPENLSSGVILGIVSIVMIGFMAWFILNLDRTLTVTQPKTSITYDTALASQDIQTKLNYLLERFPTPEDSPSILPTMFPLLILMACLIIFVLARNIIMKPIRYIFPNHLFLFGKEILKHNKRLALRQNLLWGVIVASIISIVTGFIVWLLTKNAG